jgi:hypothetical protein
MQIFEKLLRGRRGLHRRDGRKFMHCLVAKEKAKVKDSEPATVGARACHRTGRARFVKTTAQKA